MARIRTIKPEFWQDEDIASLPDKTQLLALGLLNHADDEGYFKAHEALIRAAVFPFSEDSLNIHGMLTELSNIGYLALFEGSDGKKYGLISNFSKHQKINRPSASKIKDLCTFTEDSVNPHGVLTAGKEQGTGNRERNKPPDKSDGYVFDGDTIRLTKPDYEKLSGQYPNLDIDDQLRQLDLELRGKKNWFVEMNSKLNYRNKTPAHHKRTAGEVSYL